MTDISILVIDPDEIYRAELAETLADRGYSPVLAGEAGAALACLTDPGPDLIIMDAAVKGLTPDDLLDQLDRRDMDAFAIVMAEHPDLEQGMDWVTSGVFAYLAKPLRVDNLIRVIEKGLENKQAYHQVISMARELSQANLDLEKEKAALKERTEQLRLLNDLGSELSGTLSCRKIVQSASNAVRRVAGADLTAFLTCFNPSEEVRLGFSDLLDQKWLAELTDEISREFAKQSGRGLPAPRLIRPPEDGPVLSGPFEGRKYLPLIVAGELLGMLGVYGRSRFETSQDLDLLLESMTFESAQALFNAHQHEQALKLASRDSLTGLFNRRAFDEALRTEFERYLRYGAVLSLIMIDLDRFKSVNDSFGHDAGDEVLKKVAGIINKSVRGSDLAARLGGEEFGVILPNTREPEAALLASRIQRALRETTLNLGKVSLTQTVSQGVADTETCSIEGPKDLMRLADQALYLSKKEGRNTIRCGRDLLQFEVGKEGAYACRQ